MKCPEHSFIDVPDFLQQVRRYPSIGWIYRGQADATWPLIAKAGRPEYFDPTWQEKWAQEPDIPPQDLGKFNVWRDEAVAYSQSIPQSDFECLAYAQHYGLATRLLDWTRNPLVGLYFAAETHHESDGAVYCYLPWSCVDLRGADLENVPRVARYDPRPFDRRLLTQDAVFTIHPEPQVPLSPEKPPPEAERIAPDGVNLVRFTVLSEVKSIILRQLSDIGVSRKRLFPDLQGLSEFINWETKRHLKWKRDRGEQTDSGGG